MKHVFKWCFRFLLMSCSLCICACFDLSPPVEESPLNSQNVDVVVDKDTDTVTDTDTGADVATDTAPPVNVYTDTYPQYLSEKIVFNSPGTYQWEMSHCDYLEAKGYIVGGGGRGGSGGCGNPEVVTDLLYSAGGGGGGGAGEVVRLELQALTPGVYTFTIGEPGHDSTMSGPDFAALTARHGENGGKGSEGSICWGGKGGAGYPDGHDGKNGLDWQVPTLTEGGDGGHGSTNGSLHGNGGDGGIGCSKGGNDNGTGLEGGAGGAEIHYFCQTNEIHRISVTR